MSTTNGALYLTALRSLERLDIQFVPSNLALNRTPTYGNIVVVGRNNPIPHYTGGNTKLSLDLDFHSEQTDREDVIRKCKWLEALAYNDGYDNPPEQIRITWGSLFKNNEVWIVKGVDIRYSQFNPAYGWLPVQANVKLSLELDPSSNLKKSEVTWR